MKADVKARIDAVVEEFANVGIVPVIKLEKLEEFSEPTDEKGKAEENASEEMRPQVLWLDARTLSEEDFGELLEMLGDYAGSQQTKILHGGKRYEYAVTLNRAFAAELHAFLPEKCIKLV